MTNMSPHSERYLISGGAGFIGSSLAERLAEDNHVTVVDNLSTGHNIPVGVDFHQLDVNDAEAVAELFTEHQFDYVYHYAAVVGVERTLQDPFKVLGDINGLRNILEGARLNGAKRVLYASSSEVYGEPVHIPQHEEDTPLNSRLPYAVVKNVGEVMLKAYQHKYGLDFTTFRFFNTYGPRQSQDFVMSRFMTAAKSNQPLIIYGDGSQERTFCHIDDNVQATKNAIEADWTVGQTINVGSEEVVSIRELAERVIDLCGSRSKIIHQPARQEGDMTRRQPDITKMRMLLGREPLSLDEGIIKLL